MMQKHSLFKLSIYFLSWKYKWFWCSSYSTREILLWWCALLQSTLIIWNANLSLILIYSYNVWVKVFAESSLRFKISWFNWDLTFLMLNSSISKFIKTKICKSVKKIENRCNWTEFKTMICNWRFMILTLKTRFSTILRFKTWVFKIV
jgi:hypothetical protein